MQLLSRIITVIQEKLFPVLQNEMKPLTEQEKKLIKILEVVRIELSVFYQIILEVEKDPIDARWQGLL